MCNWLSNILIYVLNNRISPCGIARTPITSCLHPTSIAIPGRRPLTIEYDDQTTHEVDKILVLRKGQK